MGISTIKCQDCGKVLISPNLACFCQVFCPGTEKEHVWRMPEPDVSTGHECITGKICKNCGTVSDEAPVA